MGKEEREEKAGKWSFVLERRYRLIGTRRTWRVREVWEEGRGGGEMEERGKESDEMGGREES